MLWKCSGFKYLHVEKIENIKIWTENSTELTGCYKFQIILMYFYGFAWTPDSGTLNFTILVDIHEFHNLISPSPINARH